MKLSGHYLDIYIIIIKRILQLFFLIMPPPYLLKLPDEIGPLRPHQSVADSLVRLAHGAVPHRVEQQPLQKPKSSKSALV